MADEPELAEGADGEWVEYLQQLLTSFGFYNGEIDSSFGATTTEAVRTLQQQYSIDEDGVVGVATWQVLTWTGTADEQAGTDVEAAQGEQAEQAEQVEQADKTPRAESVANDELDDPDTDEALAPELDADEIESFEPA